MKFKEKDYINLEKLIQKINQYAKVSVENRKIAKEWLLISKEDIEISRLLYDKKYYANSIYHLEQAFEKLIKWFYISTGRATPEEVFGHDFIIKRLKKEVTQIDDIKDFFELSSSLSDKSFSINSFEKKIEILKRNEKEIRRASKEEILSILNLINEIEKNITTKEKLIQLKKKVKSRKTFNFLKQVLLKLIPGFRIPNNLVEESISEHKIESYIKNMVLGMKLHYFCVITFPHYNTPRYPYSKDEEMGFFNYNEELGIIKSFKDVCSFYDESIKSMN